MRILAWPYVNERGNPYTHLLYGAMESLGATVEEFRPRRVLTGGYDVWHMHWPDGAFNRDGWFHAWRGAMGLRGLLRLAHLRGIRVVWTAHNVGGHETRHPRLEARTWRAIVRRLDGYISLSRAAQGKLEGAYPGLRDCPSFVIPHGHYKGAYPDEVTQEEAREALDLPRSAPVLLYFGYIRPYKNVPALLRAFRALDSEAHLVVAGNPETAALAQDVREAAAGASQVRLHLDFIPEDRVQLYFRASSGVVLPYAEILNSGSAMLALSFDRPVVVPDKGAMGELQERVGKSWVRTVPSPFTADRLAEALTWIRDEQRSPRPPLDPFEWDAIARQTLQTFRTVVERGGTSTGFLR
jgi:glycosyltransferase involved in cell wall biosynthesis